VPSVQVKRRKSGGGIARVDLFWDDAKLAVELVGHRTHTTRRQRQSDAERAARLGLEGWTVVEFTYEDVVERPEYVVEMIRAYLRQAGYSFLAPFWLLSNQSCARNAP
jgi:very-short-patch-repair endonuclease